MSVRAYLRVFRERWKLIALTVIIAVGVAVLVTSATAKVYQATAQVLVSSNASSDPLAQYQAAAFAQAQVATYAQIVDSPNVVEAVKTDLNSPLTSSALRSKITASAPTNTTLILVSATDGNPNTAAAIANSAANAFVIAIEKYSTPVKSTRPAVRLFVTNPATAPGAPTSPNAALNIILGLFVGLLLGASLAISREVIDNRVKDVEALARITGKPAMGSILQDPRAKQFAIASRAGGRSIRAENFRQLRANLQFADVDKHPRVIAVTSSVPGEGKTMVAINLASALAEAGFSVCLVDADLRRPTVAKTLGLNGGVGLTTLLIQQLALTEALQQVGANFFVLASGPTPPNPSELLASTYVRDIVGSLLKTVDYVILDTAPLLPVADGSEVAALAEGTLLVARHKVVTDPQVRRAMAALTRVNARVLGVVLNGIPQKASGDDGYGYGYSYYRTQGSTASEEPAGSLRKRRRRSKSAVETARPAPRGHALPKLSKDSDAEGKSTKEAENTL